MRTHARVGGGERVKSRGLPWRTSSGSAASFFARRSKRRHAGKRRAGCCRGDRHNIITRYRAENTAHGTGTATARRPRRPNACSVLAARPAQSGEQKKPQIRRIPAAPVHRFLISEHWPGSRAPTPALSSSVTTIGETSGDPADPTARRDESAATAAIRARWRPSAQKIVGKEMTMRSFMSCRTPLRSRRRCDYVPSTGPFSRVRNRGLDPTGRCRH